jgi:c-di-GMP-binding flagellar brake protein YcgR
MSLKERTWPNSRKYPRGNVYLKGEYRPLSPQAGGKPLKFETQNLGVGGLMFYSDRPVEVGTSLEIRLFLTGKPVDLTARVVWIKTRFDMENKKKDYAIGLEFVVIQQENIAVIIEYTIAFIGMRPLQH